MTKTDQKQIVERIFSNKTQGRGIHHQITRRDFLNQSMVAGCGLLSLTLQANFTHQPLSPGEDPRNDIELLNFLLILERLQLSLYEKFNTENTGSEIERSEYARRLGEQFRQNLDEFLELAEEQENVHVGEIVDLILENDGKPITGCSFRFFYSNHEEFYETAKKVEMNVTGAYAWIIPRISNSEISSFLTKIHSVEGRHAAYIYMLNNERPYPDPFDNPRSMREVLTELGPHIESCEF